MLEYSNGWRLSNGRKVYYPYILRDKETLKEIRRFLSTHTFSEYAQTELKLKVSDLKISKDSRFLFETPNHYLEIC